MAGSKRLKFSHGGFHDQGVIMKLMKERKLRGKEIMVIEQIDKWTINRICMGKAHRCKRTDFISHCAGLWTPGKRGFADRKVDVKEACIKQLMSWTTENKAA